MKKGSVLLEIAGLSIDYETSKGSKAVLHDFQLSLNKGEVVALVGESGSGKTSAAMAALALLPSAASVAGIIKYRGRKLNSKNEPLIGRIRGRKIGLIIQEPMASFNPLMKVGEQVLEAVGLRKDASRIDKKAKVFELLTEVGLKEVPRIYGSFPHQLSGGQLQRVMIAIALAQDPRILIADEPTAALDLSIQKLIIDLLRKLQQERKMAMLLISHDLKIVAEIADRVLVMYQGRIVEAGDVATILKAPKSSYTKTLLACRPEQHLPKSFLPVLEHSIPNPQFSSPQKLIQPTNQAEIILKVQNITVNYRRQTHKGDFPVLRDVSLQLIRGETLGVVGESGCGKTTLGKAIIGAAPLANGMIEFTGTKETSGSPPCQMVFQNSLGALNRRLTVWQLLQEPFELIRRERRHKILPLLTKLLEEVGLSGEVLNRYPEQLSGGQRQRVNIARALAGNPQVLICDEAVSALDVTVQAQILNLLLSVQQQRGLALIFISHDMDVIRHLSDRILVISEGQIVEEGEAEQVFSNPRHQVTLKLIQSMSSYPLHTPKTKSIC
jgi:peptide/nickel transport system ATP-binding protein